MSRLTLIAVLALAACVARPAAPPAFRAAEVPIWSAAAFQPGAVAGTWRQVAGFQAADSACRAGELEITPEAGSLRLTGTLCLAGQAERLAARAEMTGPGRFAVKGEEWWVLWVDSGYRTLAIGTPSGRFGLVLDRGAIPSDRLEAAREVFDFNGYGTEALRAF